MLQQSCCAGTVCIRDTNADSAKIYGVSWKAGPLSWETTRRERNMLYVSWCLDKTKFFVAVPKRDPLNFFYVVVL